MNEWFNGQIFGGLNNGATDEGNPLYWFDGQLYAYVFPPSAITGTSAQTLPSLTQAGSGDVLIQGTGNQTLPAVTGAATGDLIISGVGVQTLPALIQAGVGDISDAAAPRKGVYPLIIIDSRAERKKRRRKILKVLKVVKAKPKIEVDHNQVRALAKALENEDHQKLLEKLVSEEIEELRDQAELYIQILESISEEENQKRLFIEKTLARINAEHAAMQAQMISDWRQAVEIVRQAQIARRIEESDDELAIMLLQ